MKVFKVEISKRTIAEALANIGNTFAATNLANALEKAGVPRTNGLDYVSIAAASRIIQGLKKEGKIKNVYGGGGNTLWKFNKHLK